MEGFPSFLAMRPANATMGAGIPQMGTHPPGELGKHPSLEPSLLLNLTFPPSLLLWVIFSKCCGLILGANSRRESSATSKRPHVSPTYLCLLLDPFSLCHSLVMG